MVIAHRSAGVPVDHRGRLLGSGKPPAASATWVRCRRRCSVTAIRLWRGICGTGRALAARSQRGHRVGADHRQSSRRTAHFLNSAIDNGVTAAELSEIITHLAFYAGWPRVFSALPVVKDVFASRAA